MKRRRLVVTLLAMCVALALIPAPSYAAYVVRMNINGDRSVTVEWSLGGTDASNLSVAVDCCVVHTWPNVDRSLRFTTAPLSSGRHTIAIQVLEHYWTNTYFDPTSCKVSTRPSFRWECSRKSWTAPMVVLIPSARGASCVVPLLAGLRLEDAKRRLALARCPLGAVTHTTSDQPSGTVLGQRPKVKMRLARGGKVTLVVSSGRSPA